MTNPDDVERIATKVVPYYVVGVVEGEPEVAPEPPEPDTVHSHTAVRRPRPTWVGLIAAALGLTTVGLFIAAMLVATGGNYPAGTVLGYITVIVSISAAVTAIISLILGLQRRWAVVGLALAILGNPIVLVAVFRFFGG